MTGATFKPGEALPRLLRMTEVLELIPLSRSHLYRMIADGEFPRQVQLGARSVAWIESEIHQWMTDRIDQRDINETNYT